MILDKDTIEVMQAAIEAYDALNRKLRQMKDNCHEPYMECEIVFRYRGEEDEWFVASAYTGDWPEIISGDERAEQLKARVNRV